MHIVQRNTLVCEMMYVEGHIQCFLTAKIWKQFKIHQQGLVINESLAILWNSMEEALLCADMESSPKQVCYMKKQDAEFSSVPVTKEVFNIHLYLLILIFKVFFLKENVHVLQLYNQSNIRSLYSIHIFKIYLV